MPSRYNTRSKSKNADKQEIDAENSEEETEEFEIDDEELKMEIEEDFEDMEILKTKGKAKKKSETQKKISENSNKNTKINKNTKKNIEKNNKNKNGKARNKVGRPKKSKSAPKNTAEVVPKKATRTTRRISRNNIKNKKNNLLSMSQPSNLPASLEEIGMEDDIIMEEQHDVGEIEENVSPKEDDNKKNSNEKRFVKIGVNLHLIYEGDQVTLWRIKRQTKSVLTPIESVVKMTYNAGCYCDKYELCMFSAKCATLSANLNASMHVHLNNLLMGWKDLYPGYFSKIKLDEWVGYVFSQNRNPKIYFVFLISQKYFFVCVFFCFFFKKHLLISKKQNKILKKQKIKTKTYKRKIFVGDVCRKILQCRL